MSVLSSRERFAIGSIQPAEASAMPPVLLVLLIMMLMSLLAGPRVIADGPLIAQVCMVAVFVAASSACLISFIEPGEVTSLTVDAIRGIVTLEQTGLFARSLRDVPFSQISTVRMEALHDRHGFETAVPVLVLKSKRTLPLPAGTTEADIAGIRAIIREAA